MDLLKTVLPVFLALAVGVIVRQKRLLTREGVNALKNVAVNITLPAVMLNAFASMEYSYRNIFLTLLMFLVCLAAWFLGRLARQLPGLSSRFVPFLTTGFEAGMLGYSLFMMLYGAENISRFACVDLGQVLFVFTVYKILAGRETDAAAPSGKSLVREMFTSPTMIAIIAGLLLGATGLYRALKPSGIAGLLDECTTFLSAPTSVLILIAVGFDLVPREIPWKSVGGVILLRTVIMILLRLTAGLGVRAIGLGNDIDPALNVMFILPAPFVLPVFADDEDQRSYVSSTLSAMTLVSILLFFALAALGR